MGEIMAQHPGIGNVVSFPGLSINGFTSSSSAGIAFGTLKPFEERTTPELSGFAIAGALQQQFFGIDEAFVAVFPPPPVSGMGSIGGFKLQVEDRGDLGYEALDNVMKAITAQAYQNPALTGIFSSYTIDTPQLYADVDRTKAQQLGISVSDVFDAMQVYLGSIYINDFNQFGRTYQVVAQADKEYRSTPEDITNLRVRNDKGEMVPWVQLSRLRKLLALQRRCVTMPIEQPI
jgi:multidrug efflux pump